MIIVSYNSGEHLGRCLEHLGRQTCRPGRIVVVDNNDEAEPALCPGGVRCDLVHIRMGRNVGFAAANNAGLRHCEDFAWVALVNPDAFLDPAWIEEMLQCANARPEAGQIACQLRDAGDPGRLDGTGDVYHVSGLGWRRSHGSAIDCAPVSRQPVFGPCAAAALYRRSALVEAGGFDEDYFCYFEDVDLAFRLRLLGYECAYSPSAVAYHIGSAASGLDSDFAVYHGHRNLVWTFVKNMPRVMLMIYLPQHLIMNCVSIVYYALKGRGRLVLKAKWHAIRGLPLMWRKRAAIQRTTKVAPRRLRESMLTGWMAPYTGRRLA